MENYLFRIMRVYNYGDAFIRRYQMMNRFYSLRAPLLILVSGPPVCGKSTLVTQLADRVNVANVLQTAIVTAVMADFRSGPKRPPFWAAQENRRELFKAECQAARKGVHTDIIKCLREGKSLIIEGYHIDPTLYFQALEEVPHRKFKIIWPDDPAFSMDISAKEELEAIDATGAVVVPFLLTISEKDHAYIVENWLMSTLNPSVREELNRLGTFQQQLQHALRSFQEVQRYLLDFDDLFTVLPINIQHIEETINTMHNVILARIEAAYGQT
jgi:2-phosphoglycerate kinase